MMNKRNIIIIIAVVIIAGLICIAVPAYQSYQNDVLAQNFNKNLQNASAIEANIISSTDKFKNQNSTDVDDLISTLNDMTSKYSEELNVLNKTAEDTNNDTLKQYATLQTKRVELTSKNINSSIKLYNAIAQYYKGEKTASDAQNAVNDAQKEASDSSNELNSVITDINTLLKQNPDLNQSLHGLNLEKPFYGETTGQNQTENLTNSSTQLNSTP